MASEADPTGVRSIAVTAADVVAAVEMNETSSDHAVLRLTPPFSGRMRARLHVERGGYDGQPRPLHVEPASLLADPPAYPRPGDTEDRLREADDETYTVERHREYHATVVQQWRDRVADTIRDRVTLDTPAGEHSVTVKTLDGGL